MPSETVVNSAGITPSTPTVTLSRAVIETSRGKALQEVNETGGEIVWSTLGVGDTVSTEKTTVSEVDEREQLEARQKVAEWLDAAETSSESGCQCDFCTAPTSGKPSRLEDCDDGRTRNDVELGA